MTHTKDEALDLALDALESTAHGQDLYELEERAITAIKQALAAPVPDLTHDQWDEWQDKHGLILEREALDELRSMLYTTPPAQRQWVGLTKEETEWCTAHRHLIEWANDKLKEKNT